jgi:hypothetical protein
VVAHPDWVTVKSRGLRNAVLRTPSILPANCCFLRAAGEGFEPSLTDPELISTCSPPFAGVSKTACLSRILTSYIPGRSLLFAAATVSVTVKNVPEGNLLVRAGTKPMRCSISAPWFLQQVSRPIRPLLAKEALEEFYRARYDSARQFLAELLARLASVT